MTLANNDTPGVSQTTVSAVNGEDTCRSVHRRQAGLTIRVRNIDCMLADIRAQIQALKQERTYLGLMREELTGTEACNISLKQRALGRISSNP